MELPLLSEDILDDPTYSRKTIGIRDDRILSYSECGNLESSNICLFNLGMMASSLSVILMHEQALNDNLRMISIDYPGTGESTPVENRTLQDWALDVEEFCNRVLPKDQKFQLLGQCLGAPQTLAAWARLMDRVSKVTLVCPWVGDYQTNPWFLKYTVQQLPLQGYIPTLAGPFLSTTPYFTSPLSYFVPEGKLQSLLRGGHEIIAYSQLQGSAGNREMVKIALTSSSKKDFWDPILNEIAAKYEERGEETMPPLQIYHGSTDFMVSEDACHVLIGWLKNAKCKVDFESIKGADHFTVLLSPTHLATIMEPLGNAAGK